MNNFNFDKNTTDKLSSMLNNGNINELLSQIPPDTMKNLSALMNNNSNNNDNYIEREKSLTEDFNKKIAACQAKINEQSAVIDSITTQYNEIMDIARQYRDEAIKWRSKFI